VTVIDARDTGPGVPERAKAHFFEAFRVWRGRAAPALGSPSPPRKPTQAKTSVSCSTNPHSDGLQVSL
jgi:hypothetical protein